MKTLKEPGVREIDFDGRAFETFAGWSWEMEVSTDLLDEPIIQKAERADFATKEEALRDMRTVFEETVAALHARAPNVLEEYYDVQAQAFRKVGGYEH